MQPTETCIGCGAVVPRIEGPIHRYMTSAPGCWALFGEITAHMYGPGAGAARWQLCVDAFAVQHPGGQNPQAVASVAIHLQSLYAQLELGLVGAAVQEVIVKAAAAKGRYRWLVPPSFAGCRTVGHVVERLANPAQAVEEWAADAWGAWRAHHEQVAEWYAALEAPRYTPPP